jgi:hypothetical protein
VLGSCRRRREKGKLPTGPRAGSSFNAATKKTQCDPGPFLPVPLRIWAGTAAAPASPEPLAGRLPAEHVYSANLDGSEQSGRPPYLGERWRR